MTGRRLGALALALLVIASVAGATPGVLAIDDEHPLASEEQITRYEETGVVSANLTRVDATLTIAETNEQADIDGAYVDSNKHFVCIDYHEEIPRTLRIYYPAAYFTPRVAEAESITSDHVADLEPTGNRSATALTVTFEAPDRACFPIGVEAGTYFGVKSWIGDRLGNWTGWQPPSLGGGQVQWRYVPDGAFANQTYPIVHNTTDITMQYARHDDGDRRWINVPGCDDPTEQAVCHYDGTDDNTTVLLSTRTEPPDVRWKPGDDSRADLDSAWNDLTTGVGQAAEFFGSLFGGGGGSDTEAGGS